MVVYKPRPKTMDEASVFLLHREGPKTEDQTKKKTNKDCSKCKGLVLKLGEH